MGFERLAAGVIVIGLIVFGASILATPDEVGVPDELLAPDEPVPDAPLDEEEGDEAEEEEGDEVEQTEERAPRRKGKRDGG